MELKAQIVRFNGSKKTFVGSEGCGMASKLIRNAVIVTMNADDEIFEGDVLPNLVPRQGGRYGTH